MCRILVIIGHEVVGHNKAESFQVFNQGIFGFVPSRESCLGNNTVPHEVPCAVTIIVAYIDPFTEESVTQFHEGVGGCDAYTFCRVGKNDHGFVWNQFGFHTIGEYAECQPECSFVVCTI